MDDWKKGASLNLLKQARDGMMTGFVWRETKQGADYWAKVHDNLSEMVNELTAERVVGRLNGEVNG